MDRSASPWPARWLQPAPAAHFAARLPVPGPACGPYPQRDAGDCDRRQGPTARPADPLAARASALGRGTRRRAFVAGVRRLEADLPPPGSQAFEGELLALRARLGHEGLHDGTIGPACALLLRLADAVLGLRLFDTQLIAARILLDNRLAEMATGEGKTHAVMLAAATAALAGVPVHVATANPYLAARDAGQLAALYRAAGLTVGAIRAGAADPQRRDTWRCDVAYCTASDLVFDYLRDRLAAAASVPAEPLLRGLCMVIVDEADSVLIDEARTPFILARERRDPVADAQHRQALAYARQLRADIDFRLDTAGRRATLTAAGSQRLAGLTASSPCHPGDSRNPPPPATPLWTSRRHREELVERALDAIHLYRRDVDYLVRERNGRREVAIIDATTGRVAEGRRWSQGLHQLIELAQGCETSPLQETLAQLTYQRFFPRYWRLAGTSGTLREARRELCRVYGLAVEPVPLREPSRRVHEAPRVYATAQARWHAVQDAIAASHAAGLPVLAGCDTVAEAQRLGARLQASGLAHQRLDARQDEDEARCIAAAGTPGCITVATNMAGRGTDIALGPGVAAVGGLHLVACQLNASARIDRQLHGRCGRGGDPGRVTTLLSLDEGLLGQRLPRALRAVLRRLAPGGRALPAWIAGPVLRAVQAQAQRQGRRERARLLEADRLLLDGLRFGARAE